MHRTDRPAAGSTLEPAAPPEGWYRLLFEAAGDPMLVLRPDGAVLDANEAAVAAYGYPRHAFAGLHIRDLRDPADHDRIDDQLARARVEPVRFETRHRRRDGTTFPVEVHSRPAPAPDGSVLVSVVRDLSERARAADALRASEERLRLALAASSIVVYQQDRDLRYTWVHNLDRAVWPEDVVGRTDFDLLPPDQAAHVAAIKRAAMTTGETVRVETAATAPTGTRFYDLSVEPLRDDLGAIVGITGTALDITARRRTEERLRAGEAWARLALEIAQLGSWRYDPATGLVAFDERMRSICGLPSDSATLALPAALARVHPDDRERVAAAVAMALDPAGPGNCRIECRILRPDGGERWLFANGQTEFTDTSPSAGVRAGAGADRARQAVAFVGAALDVTNRRRTEERLRFLAEAGSALAGSLDYEQTPRQAATLAVPVLADYAFVDLLGPAGLFERVAWKHADPRWQARLDATMPGFQPPANHGHHPASRALETGEPVLVPEIDDAWMQAAAYSPEHLAFMREVGLRSVLTAPLLARGRALGVLICCFTAESGRRHGADDIALVGALGDRVALAVDNARLYRAAQDELAERQAFVEAVAHDLKNPLAAASGQAQLLRLRLRRGAPPDPEALATGLAGIEAAVARTVGLIEELLDAARLQTGHQLALRREPTDLVALARRKAEEHQHTTERHAIRMEAAAPEIVGPFDGARLERVLDNLLGNAVKFSPAGGAIVVRVAREDGPDDPIAVLSVADHGVGIPALDLPGIFGRFSRGGNVEGRIGGSGLGLAGAKAIVEQHGGTIAVESTEGAGSTFTLRLPL
jgi:PAS domain S-box-containing protein